MRLNKQINITSSRTNEALSEALEFINSSLESMSLSKKESNRAQLMAEEALVKLVEHGDFDVRRSMHISITKFFGKVTISLTVPGKEFNFAQSLGFTVPFDDEEMTSDTAAAIQNILLRSFEDKLKYKHRNVCNRIFVTVSKSAFSSMYWVLGALFLAVCANVVLKNYVPPAVCDILNADIFSPVKTIFMNALKMCAIPIVFLSIASCVSQFNDLSEIKRIGTSLLICFTLMQTISACVGVGAFLVFQPGRSVDVIPASISSVPAGAAFSVLDTFVNMMPSNIVKPFLEGDMLQLIVLAVFIGVSAGVLEAKTIRSFLDEANEIFMKITGAVMRFVPLVIFCSITSLLLTTGYSTLLSLLGIVGTVLAGYAALILIYYILVIVLCRFNPSHLFAKSLPMLITAFSTSSSIASIPDGMKCAENMGISQKIYSLSIPLGATLNPNASCVYVAAATLFLARVYGVEISSSALSFMIFSTVILVMAAPSISGATIIVFSILMSQLGVPIEAVSLIMGVEPLLDMFATPCNCFGTMAATLLTSARYKMLNVEKYNRT